MSASARRLCLVVCLLSAVLLGSAVDAQRKPAKPSTPTPVAASFRCPAGLDCASPDRIQGDFGGTYAERLGSSGDFLFDLPADDSRSVFLDFSRRLPTPSGAPSPCTVTNCRRNAAFPASFSLTSLWPNSGSDTNPVDNMGTELPNGFLSLVPGTSSPARFKLNFTLDAYPNVLWTIRFNSTMYPGSSNVTVTRSSDGNSWVIEALDSDVAELVSMNLGPGKSATVNEGYYSMPFRITVTK